jgi:hypothetical protein
MGPSGDHHIVTIENKYFKKINQKSNRQRDIERNRGNRKKCILLFITLWLLIVFAIIYIMLFVAKEDEPISANNTVASKQIQPLSDTYNQNTNSYKQNQSPVSTSVHSAKETIRLQVQFLKTAASIIG